MDRILTKKEQLNPLFLFRKLGHSLTQYFTMETHGSHYLSFSKQFLKKKHFLRIPLFSNKFLIIAHLVTLKAKQSLIIQHLAGGTCIGYLLLGPWIQKHNGTEIHRIHVFGVSDHESLYNDSVCFLTWMEGVPKCKQISVWAQVRKCSTESNSIERSLPTACNFWCGESCTWSRKSK